MRMNEWKEIVRARLTMDRFQHTLRVIDTALELAVIHDLSTDEVELACLFHDFAKCDTEEVLRKAMKAYDLPKSLLDYHHELWHGPVAAKQLKYELDIPDEAVYNAVYFHTTGREGMSALELVVFIADYMEPARNFPGIEEVRELAKVNLKVAVHRALQNSMLFILQKGETIHPDTLYAYNDLTKKIRSVK